MVPHLRALAIGIASGGVVALILLAFKTDPTAAAIIAVCLGVVLWVVAELWERTAVRPARVIVTPPNPKTLRPPTPEELSARAEEIAWGDARYKAKSEWNAAERRSYLFLYVRDKVASVGYRVSVLDPSNMESEWHGSQAVTQGSLVNTYPDDFKGAPPLITGPYRVIWRLIVSDQGKVSMENVAEDQFDVPSSSPAISKSDQT